MRNWLSDKISYNKWIEADNKMKFFMLGYMIDSLMVSYMNSPNAESIIDSLEMKFGKKSSAHVEGLWEKYIRTRLSEGEDARQHVINMGCFKLPVGLCNEIETLIKKFWWG